MVMSSFQQQDNQPGGYVSTLYGSPTLRTVQYSDTHPCYKGITKYSNVLYVILVGDIKNRVGDHRT